MPSAGRVTWAKFRVITVTVVSLMILATLLYALFGGALLAPRAIVYLYVPDASGLTNESPVRVDGIDIGRVSGVELSGSGQPDRVVRVTLSLRRERLRTIPSDSITQISSDSLVGDKFVDITSGTSPGAIGPGGELIYKNQPELVRSLDLSQFTAQLRLVDATLSDIEQGRSQFGQFVEGDRFYKDLQTRLAQLQAGIRDAVSTTGAVGALLNTDQLQRQVGDVLVRIDQEIAKVQSGQGPAGQLLRDSAQYDQLLSAAQGFRKSVATLGAGDLMQSDRAYVSVNQWLAALIQSVDNINRNPQIATTELYDNLNGQLKELRDTLRDFRLNPKKYLRLKIF